MKFVLATVANMHAIKVTKLNDFQTVSNIVITCTD